MASGTFRVWTHPVDIGLDMLNVLTFWQSILKGLILVAAILLNEKIPKRVKKGPALQGA